MANQNGFTINLSAHTLEQADRLADLNIGPVATLVLDDTAEVLETPAGREVFVCPAQVENDVTCLDCEGCATVLRGPTIGFLPHGCQHKQAR